MKLRSAARLSLSALVAAAALSAAADFAPAQEKTAAATRQYNSAVGLQNRAAQNPELFDQAAAEWEEFLRDFPSDPRVPRAQMFLGFCQLRADKPEQAVATFEQLLQSAPKFDRRDQTLLLLGAAQYTLAKSGKRAMYEKAAATFSTLVSEHAQSQFVPEALFRRGECLYALERKDEAARMYQQVLQDHAGHPNRELLEQSLYALGVTQRELGQLDVADKTLQKFLDTYKDSKLLPDVILQRGEVFFAQKRYDVAAKWFASATGAKGFRNADVATMRQAEALARLNRYGEAAALYASVPKQFPRSDHLADAKLSAGQCYYLDHRFDEARPLLNEVVEAGGKPAAEAVHWLARMLLEEKKPKEALALVDRVLPGAVQSDFYGQLLMDRADALFDLPERRKEAVAAYATLASKDPKSETAPRARYMAAFAALNAKDFPAALSHATAFLEAYKNHQLTPDVMYVAAEARLQSGDYGEAEKLYAQLLDSYANSKYAETWRVRRGICRYLAKDYAGTIEVLQPALAQVRSPDARAEIFYRIGSSQAELGETDAAIKSLENALQTKPDGELVDETLLVLAGVYQKADNLDAAKTTARRLIDERPKSPLVPEAWYRLGEYSFAAGDYDQAAEAYQKVIDGGKPAELVPAAMLGLGWTQLRREDYNGAVTTFTAMLEKYASDPLAPRARHARGIARQQLKQYGPAMEDLQAIFQAKLSKAEKSDARLQIGLCQMDMEKWADAEKTFRAILDEDADFAATDRVLYELSWALKYQGKDDAAVESFARLAKQFPDSKRAAEAFFQVGEAAYQNGQYRDAVVNFEEARKRATTPELGEQAVYKLGWSYFKQENYKMAHDWFAYQRRAYKDRPLAANAAFMQGESLMKQGDYEGALAAYSAVHNAPGKNFDVLALLHAGQAAGQLKRWDDSLRLLTQAESRFGESELLPEILYEKGRAMHELGELDKAVAVYQSVIDKTIREVAAAAQFQIGEIQFARKQHEEAIVSFFKVVDGYGDKTAGKWKADALYEAGRCFDTLGEKAQAKQQFQAIVDKYPNSDKAPIAKKLIEDLSQ